LMNKDEGRRMKERRREQPAAFDAFSAFSLHPSAFILILPC
jgi:hypothetical protein